MKFLDLKTSLKDFTLFSTGDIRKLEKTFHQPRLSEWLEKGYIKKIIRGYYIFSDLSLNEDVLFEIANKIYNPSYVSLEMALSFYQLIPENVYGITSVTTRKTAEFMTAPAQFSYRSIKPNCFFGYRLIRRNEKTFKIAEAEKAILDYLYLNPNLKAKDDFDAMRIDVDSFNERVNKENLSNYLEAFGQKTLTKRANTFMEYMRNA